MSLGAFTVVALYDGTFDLHADTLLIEQHPGDVHDLLAQAGLANTVCSTVNAYLIDTGDACVLIDAGAGSLQGDGLGHLLTPLRAAGYAPEDIDLVLLTHLHSDHVGGITHEGHCVFPNAMVRADEREAAFWLNPANAPDVDESVRASFDGAMASLQPYVKTARFTTFQPGDQLAPGITAIALQGHTIGHTGFRVASEGQCMMFCGDVLHVAAVQLADPGIAIRYDSLPIRANETRDYLLADAAAQNYWLAASHSPFPGIGRVRRMEKGYEWEPINKNGREATIK
jgi:glyoxylase-like metal-dependent hydrolase (beta-lactamase superfamily II)